MRTTERAKSYFRYKFAKRYIERNYDVENRRLSMKDGFLYPVYNVNYNRMGFFIEHSGLIVGSSSPFGYAVPKPSGEFVGFKINIPSLFDNAMKDTLRFLGSFPVSFGAEFECKISEEDKQRFLNGAWK